MVYILTACTPLAEVAFNWNAFGYSLVGFAAGFLLGALWGKRSQREKP